MKDFFLSNLPDDVYIGPSNYNKLSLKNHYAKIELKFDFDINEMIVIEFVVKITTCVKNVLNI